MVRKGSSKENVSLHQDGTERQELRARPGPYQVVIVEAERPRQSPKA